MMKASWLGKLSQRYIDDPDLRGILTKAELDTNKMKAFEDQKLLLITSVIHSDKFELQGERMQEAEGGAELQENPIFKILKPSKIHYKGTYIPPEMATRTSKGPFLFKCNHVEYNDELNRLEIKKGEFVGKTIQVHRDAGHDQEEDAEYNDTLVDLDTDKTDSPVLILIRTDHDKLDRIIKKEVLAATDKRAGRKAHVSKYLNWFSDALISDENKLLLDEPLTSEDCQFLRAVYLPCSLNSTVLDLTSLKKKEIQAYAIVFKKLHDLPEEKLNDLKMTWLDLNVKSKETCRMAYQSENNV
ncbi:hypothetical protein OS493_003726 [Desmophyllum pertusum]|uniref:Uncharacterized protein n=1 Tax=Desmophyllum pertusum TaxID=174260 RepID=A0A9X0A611_9CNID|nr:hypothetical protein OS493_003726 [Desmophyllum pertusum]